MENKLELKHLAPYLPYGVQMKLLHFPIGDGIRTLELDCGHDFHYYLKNNWVRPLLIPLSELKNYPDDEYKDVKYTVATTDCIEDIPYWVWEKLVELHFDVYGLLEAGLALNKLEHIKQ